MEHEAEEAKKTLAGSSHEHIIRRTLFILYPGNTSKLNVEDLPATAEMCSHRK